MSATTHDTFVIERRYPQPRPRLYAALSDPDLKKLWYAVERTGVMKFEMDFRTGGAERQQYTLGEDSPFPGALIENDGRFEDIVPEERIVLTSTSTFAGNRISTALITYELADDGDGTKLTLTHQAAFYEGSDGPEIRRDGWEVLLDTLGRTLVS